ncbi:MAG: hypothetical protein WED81_07575, partial [Rhodothermales bacterium]
SHASAFVTDPEGGAGLIPVRLVRSVGEAFPHWQKSAGSVDVVMVDVETLGVDESQAILGELKAHPAMSDVPVVAWIKRQGHAAAFEGENVVVVKCPPAQKDRFAQIGQIVRACRTGGDELRRLAEESLKLR